MPSPPQSPADAVSASGRYVYLLGRLRNRQITMEEATELFALQQSMLRDAQARAIPPPPPPGSAPTAGPAARAPAGGAMPMTLDDERLAYGLLILGAGAGVLAAVLKRSQEGPKTPARSPR